MKSALLLGLFTGSILAATTGEGIKPANVDTSADIGLPKYSLSLAAGGSQQAWCGGFTAFACAMTCGRLHYPCYQCLPAECKCLKSGC
ncbi:uncharacterized protein MAM_06054 [Metarhizium album ARSEF 1941]|uniref:Uncharacterized protein n=1 Tax=Metarhizium album (strain ARSEF 1941) TaxID=1081103 RepID=A0A0B2WJK1_METAS|nr:uncharacterized protein MAM_06054 [Metarhizium album ARSEF 1941]KHN96206.1 hypothetical protein MAM_06054 [Metarhizium album ARSEF 1941]